MTWLVSPLVSGGIALSACSGQFRRLGRTDAVIATSGAELSLFSVSVDGKLSLCFKQPVLCHIRGVQVLKHHQQGCIDQLVTLLESGNLTVLQHDQQVDRFIVVQELSLAYGAVDADHLCNKLAVSCHGTSIAVAAAKGRIACISSTPQGLQGFAGQPGGSALWHKQQAVCASDTNNGRATGAMQGWQQLSEPVVYAATAPRVAGAFDLSRGLQERMELGSIVDLAFFNPGSCLSNSSSSRRGEARSLQGSPCLEYLAVISHRAGEDASEMVLFSWNVHSSQLCKLGLVALPHHGTEANMGRPLHLTAVPKSGTAMVLIGAQALLILDCAAVLLSPTAPCVSATVELQGQHSIIDQGHADLQQQQKATHQTELCCLIGRCVTATSGTAGKHLTECDTGQDLSSAGEHIAPQQVFEHQVQQQWEQQEEQVAGLGPANGREYVADDYEELFATAYMGNMPVPTSSDSDDMDDESASSQEDQHAPVAAPAASVGQQDGPALVTAWAWMPSGAHGLASAAAVHPLSLSAAAATDTHSATPDAVVHALVIATASGSLIKLSLLVEVARSSAPAGCGELQRQSCGIYISKVQQLVQLHSGPAGLLLPLQRQCLLAVTDSRSRIQVLAPAVDNNHCATAGELTSDAVATVAVGTQPSSLVSGLAPGTAGLQQQPQQQPILVNDAPAPAAAAAGTPPDHQSTETAAAGSNLLGSALGRLNELMLESQGQRPQVSSHGRPGTPSAAGMDLNSLGGQSAAAAAAGLEYQAAAAAAAAGLEYQAAADNGGVSAPPADGSSSGDAAPYAAVAGTVVADESTSAQPQRQQHELVPTEGNKKQSMSKLTGHFEASIAYRVVQDLQLLGPIESCIVAQQRQGLFPQSAAGVAPQRTPGLGPSSAELSIAEAPAVIAASRLVSGGLRVVRPGTAAQPLLSGPVGMLSGATGIWPVESSPHSLEHAVLVISFSAASRALSLGACFTDVSDVLRLQISEPTVFAACVGDGVMLQVTPSGARLCCMDEMPCGGDSSSGQRQWLGAAKSSRVSQQQSSNGADPVTSDGSLADTAADVLLGEQLAAAAAAADIGMHYMPSAVGTADTAGPAAVETPFSAALSGPAQSSVVLLQQHESKTTALPPTATGSAATTASDCDTAAAVQNTEQWSAHAFGQEQQQHQMPSRVVLAVAVPGAAVMYLNSGHLVMLEVCCLQQHKQQQHKQQQPSVAVSPAVMHSSTEQRAPAAPSGPQVCRKRFRKHWSLADMGSLQLQQQVSCLQMCSADDCFSTPAAAVAGATNGSSSRLPAAFSHYIFAGCYDGSIQVCAVSTGRSSSSSSSSSKRSRELQVIHTFCVEQLHPLRLLLQVTAGPSSRAAAAHAVTSAVPNSCLVIHHTSVPCQQPVREAEGCTGCGSSESAGNSGAMHSRTNSSNSLALLLMVSYRNGDVALYQLTKIPRQQQQQQQQASKNIVDAAEASHAGQGMNTRSCIQLRALSQMRLPGAPPKLQLCGASGLTAQSLIGTAGRDSDQQSVDQQVLAAGDRLWVLQLSRNTHQVKLRSLITPQAMLAVGLQLPADCASQVADAADTVQQVSSTAGKSSVGQEAGLVQAAEATDAVIQYSPQHHLACVLPNGQLQLLAVPAAHEAECWKVKTWLEGLHVSQIQPHRGSQLLLATCTGPNRSHLHRSEVTGRQPPVVSWLQCLDASTGAKVVGYQPSRGQTISCMGSWAVAAKTFASGPWPRSDTNSSPQQQQQQQQQQQFGAPGGSGSSRGGIAAAVRLLFGRQTPDTTGPTHRQSGGPVPGSSATGTTGDTTQACAGTSGASDHAHGYADLLHFCSHLASPASGTGYLPAAGGPSGHSTHRVGPLVILGTEIADIADQWDGCKGQVIVLRLLKSMAHGEAKGLGFTAHSQVVPSDAAGTSAAAAAAADGEWSQVAADHKQAARPAAAAGYHGYLIQRVARLRMPEPVTAVCGFNKELLLVAAGSTLAVYRLQQDKLQQAAHCFTRAPVVSLSVAGHGSDLVMAADMFQGVTAFQLEVQQATGQVSIKAAAAHMDVRRVKQVACLPPVPVATGHYTPPNSSSSSSRTEGCTTTTAASGRAHCLGLDRRGYAFEVSWAKERVVPTKTLMTTACMPLGGAAAALHVPDRVSACTSDGGSSSSSSSDDWTVKCVYELTGNEDIFLHWQDPLAAAAAMPGSGSSCTGPAMAAAGDAASYAMAATKEGAVLQLQKLPAVEGRLLQHIEQVILQHPVTRALCIGAQQLLKHQQGSNSAAAGLAMCKPPAKLAAVDARVLGALLLLPLELQQRVLHEAGLEKVLYRRDLRLLQGPMVQQAFLDSILCRLQVLPSWE